MKICSKCNTQYSDDLSFCSRCGNSLLQPNMDKPVEVILARSESYEKKLEDNWEEETGKLSKIFKNCSLVMLVAVAFPFVLDVLNGDEIGSALSDWIRTPFPLMYLIGFAILAAFKAHYFNKAQNVHNIWKSYCRNESLTVSNTKINGTTNSGTKIQLSYRNIKSVSTRYYTSSGTGMMQVASNYILEIRDVADRVIQFYSFSNARDLRDVIDKQKKMEIKK